MSRPEVVADHQKLTALAREQSEMREIVEAYNSFRAAEKAKRDAEEVLRNERDPDIQEYARQEIAAAEERMAHLEERSKVLLLPKDPNDERDIVVEIQGAVGGDEAELFARDLFEMYSRWAQSKGWKVEVIEAQDNGIGGFSKIIFEIHGRGAYSQMKFEGGPHRVQRVPKTESQGRVHTSVATVSVLPEPDAVRRSMVRSGNRSDKVRTYNFKENRVTDHRIDLTLYKLDRIMQGELDELVSALIAAERAEQLAGATSAT